MKLTEQASDAIVTVMNDKGLDTEEWYLEFRLTEDGSIGLGFTQTALRQTMEYGKLRLTIDGMIDTGGVVIDYGEHEGKYGLFFLAEKANRLLAEPVNGTVQGSEVPPVQKSPGGTKSCCGTGNCDCAEGETSCENCTCMDGTGSSGCGGNAGTKCGCQS